MKDKLPAAASDIASSHSKLWSAYKALGKTASSSGPLGDREKRLVKLGLAIAIGSEGAVHSHVRRALQDGFSADEIKHTALLAIPTIGFPRAMAALSWITDITDTN
ncbi:MAG: carboxymuconolactone decarboxylase family protein [Marinicaulis sp.]|nr:carboxymuconolactone decarboxylase family protein [Marinicaulis sp.]